MAEVVDEVEEAVVDAIVEILLDVADESEAFVVQCTVFFAQFHAHVPQGVVGIGIHHVGAEATDGVAVGVVQHIGVVPLLRVIDGLGVCLDAVLEYGWSHEEAVGAVEAERLQFRHGMVGTAVCFLQECRVGCDLVMVPCSRGPQHLVPILMVDAKGVVGDVPEAVESHFGAQQRHGVATVDGGIACPLSTIACSGMEDALVGVVVDGPYRQGKSGVEHGTVGVQPLCLRGEAQEHGDQQGQNPIHGAVG